MTDSRIAMNHATVRRQWDLRHFTAGCARHRIRTVGIWRDKVEEVGLATARALLNANDLRVLGYNRIGPLVAAAPAERRARIDDGKRVIDQAAELGAQCVLVFPGGLVPGSKSTAHANAQTMDAIAELLPRAREANIALAIEPLHPMIAADRSCINTMAQANDICDTFGEGIGIIVDTYHVWWDSQLETQIRRAGAARLLGLQISDWLLETKGLLNDRGMMGDGVIDLPHIDRLMRAAGYSGDREIEIFSDRWWANDPDEVMRIAVERCAGLFGNEGPPPH
jgi:sugar phosphate isomerase/epimerase